MRLRIFRIALVAVALCTLPILRAQTFIAGSEDIRLSLDRLTHFGNVLMIGAHPDDENTSVLAYLARGRRVRTAYLSLTRGEGGQNLIGPEKGALLGVIRTQELLAARRIDGAEQYFTRAIDFGYSKSPEEAIAKWGHDEVLSDIVWVIREFRPDVVLLRFSGTPRDGHGHHQASAILGREAVTAAADASRFPEQLKYVQPWKTPRMMQVVTFEFQSTEQMQKIGEQPKMVPVPTGQYDPVLGYSYSEIAGMSRSQHRSQGMGAPQRRGNNVNYLLNLGPEDHLSDIFDGLDISWKRVPGSEQVAALLAKAGENYLPAFPIRAVPSLLEAREAIRQLKNPDAAEKLTEIDSVIAKCGGLWMDATTPGPTALPGDHVEGKLTVINRSPAPVRLALVEGRPSPEHQLPNNTPVVVDLPFNIPADAAPTQPYWLRLPPKGNLYDVPDQRERGIAAPFPYHTVGAMYAVHTKGDEGGEYRFHESRPLWNRYVDETRGELTRPFVVVPPVTVRITQNPIVFPSRAPKTIEVELTSQGDGQTGDIRLQAPAGWSVSPATQHFQLSKESLTTSLKFQVTPPAGASEVDLRAIARTAGGREYSSSMVTIAYSHIPQQTVFEPAASKGVRSDIRVLAHKVGYIAGPGDEVPDALEQIGCEVTMLNAIDLETSDLSRFDAIVTGVRAYNVRSDLRTNERRLLEYVQNGGTMVVQYNTLSRDGTTTMGPYPLTISHDRVSVEEVPVAFIDPKNPLLNAPNHITEEDFAGWVQERGLYFASSWDSHYEPLFEMHDPGEPDRKGSTLVTRYGKGVYVFTALSFFRELPAGVPGAYRLMANFISAGKTWK